jgi:hypothetical protein
MHHNGAIVQVAIRRCAAIEENYYNRRRFAFGLGYRSPEEFENESEDRSGDVSFDAGNREGFQDLNGNSELGLWDFRGTHGSEPVYPLNCLTKGFTTAVLKSTLSQCPKVCQGELILSAFLCKMPRSRCSDDRTGHTVDRGGKF